MDQQTQATNQNLQPLSEKERRFLKRRQKEIEYYRQIRQRKIKKILILLLPALLVVGGIALFIINRSPRELQTGVPRIEISPKEYDLGNVSMAAGLVKKTFEIKNIGSGSLKIEDIRTSCHCTTAVLKMGDKKSPESGMYGSGFWSQNISPDQTAYLEVIFDPAYHGPQGIGPAVRAVYISTNDPENKRNEILLNANVTP